jgi:heparin binding hemagglutinin HbhA
MSRVTDLRKTMTENSGVYALVGATDLAVAKAREVQHRAASAREDLDLRALPAILQAKAQQAPTIALTKALETAGLAEEAYGDLSARGKKLIDRIAKQAATKELLNQSKLTISRGKAVVTTVRRGGKDTQTAAKAAVTTARRDVADVVDDTQRSVATRTTTTKRAVKRTTTTAKRRASRTKSTAKATATSAGKTATAASKATQAAADKVGS